MRLLPIVTMALLIIMAIIIAGCTKAYLSCGSRKHGEVWQEAGRSCSCDDGDVACTPLLKSKNECVADSDCPVSKFCPSQGVCASGECFVRCLSLDEYREAGLFEFLGCNSSMDPYGSLGVASQEMDGNDLIITAHVQGDCTLSNARGYSRVYANTIILFFDFDKPGSGCECAHKLRYRVKNTDNTDTIIIVSPLYWSEGITNFLCDGYTPCLQGFDCVMFPDARTAVCAKAPFCNYYQCPNDTACISEMGFPSRVGCVTTPAGQEGRQ